MGERNPKFGDRMRGIYASLTNPKREGIYVETIYRARGQINPGKYYRITDGRGLFWEYPPESTEFVDPPADSQGGGDGQE